MKHLARCVAVVDLPEPSRTALPPASEAVLAQALALARWHDADLHLLHVCPPQRRFPVMGSPLGVESVLGQLAGLADGLRDQGFRMRSAVLSADPVVSVADYAQREGADLVVVAQRGQFAGAYWPDGAFATGVGRLLECPIVAVPIATPRVPGDEAEPLFTNILCAIDESPASRRGLSTALVLAQQSGGHVLLMHVRQAQSSGQPAEGAGHITDGRFHVVGVDDELALLVPPDARDWCEVESVTVPGIPHDAICATALAREADLIVMGLARRPQQEQLTSGSTARRVLQRAACPVLLVPGPSAALAGERRGGVEREWEMPMLA